MAIDYKDGIYERICYPKGEALDELVKAQVNYMSPKIGNVLRSLDPENIPIVAILDLGVGSGLISLSLVRSLKDVLEGWEGKLVYCCVDNDPNMLDIMRESIASKFIHAENKGQQTTTVPLNPELNKQTDQNSGVILRSAVSGNIDLLVIKSDLSVTKKKCYDDTISELYSSIKEQYTEKRVEVIGVFSAFLLHHLRYPLSFINSLTRLFKELRFVCLSEMAGDHAAFSNRFDLVTPIRVTSENKEFVLALNKRHYFQVIRYIHKQLERINWMFNNCPSASDINLLYNAFGQFGFKIIQRDKPHERYKYCSLSTPYTVQLSLSRILSACGLKNNPSIFSAFPPEDFWEKGNPSEESCPPSSEPKLPRKKEDFVKKLYEYLSIYEFSDDTSISLQNDYNLYFLEKSPDSASTFDYPGTFDENERIYHVSRFHYSDFADNNTAWQHQLNDMLGLIRNGKVENPYNITSGMFDFYAQDFYNKIPSLQKTEQAYGKTSEDSPRFNLVKFILANNLFCGASDLEAFSMYEFISKYLPVKPIIITHIGEDCYIAPTLQSTGELAQIDIYVPKSIIDNRNDLNGDLNALVAKCLNTEELKKLFSAIPARPTYEYAIFNDIKSVLTKQVNKKSISLRLLLNEEKAKCLADCFKNLIEFANHNWINKWKQTIEDFLLNDEYDRMNVVNALSIYTLMGPVTEYYNIPSLDSWTRDDLFNSETHKELTAGTFIIWGDEQTKVDVKEVLYFLTLRNRIPISILVQKHQESIIDKSRNSAIASIMTRNGSHNIGSHVLSAVTSSYTDKDEDDRLFSYVQQRMEFIAQIATSAPRWTYGALFYRQLWKNFIEQDNLLRFIAQAEGLSYGTNDGSHKITLNAFYQKDSKALVPINAQFASDFQVGIPGGIIGFHAFYTILENIIRNSAKHSWVQSKEKDKNLEINVKVDDDSQKDYYVVEIWDNVSKVDSNPSDPLDIKTNKLFCHSFIDEFGSLKQGHWGLAEIKICAGFLAQRDMMDLAKITDYDEESKRQDSTTLFNEKSGSGIVRAIRNNLKIKKDTGGNLHLDDTKDYFLGYQFCIKKPKFALFIGFDCEAAATSEGTKGIYFKKKLTDEEHFNYEYVVIRDNKDTDFSTSCSDNHSPTIEDLTNNIYCYLLGLSEPEDKTTERKQKCQDVLAILEKLPLRTIIVSDRICNIINRASDTPKDDSIIRRLMVVDSSNQIVHSKRKIKVDDDLINKLRVEWIRKLASDFNISLPENVLTIYLNASGGKDIHAGLDKYLESVYNRYAAPFIQDELSKQGISVLSIPFFSKIYKSGMSKDVLVSNMLSKKTSSQLHELDHQQEYRKIHKQLISLFIIHQTAYFSRIEETKDENVIPDTYTILSDFKLSVKSDDTSYCNILLNKHSLLERNEDNTCAWYSEALSGSQITYHSLINQKDKESFQSCLLDVVESSLSPVMILDERIADFFNGFSYPERLIETRTYVVQNIMFGSKIFRVAKSRYPNDPDNNDAPPDEASADDAASSLLLEYAAPEDSIVTIKEHLKYAIIHQSLFDKLESTHQKLLIKYLNENVKHVFITSGRGDIGADKRTLNRLLQLHTKYIPFGNVEYCIKREFPDKTVLIKMLANVWG
ncbi:MAG: class I SAM-dependent methyltransferase [Kiritimatiellae bacterium]|nr:class I SAM-dependent methyltransferase [Kiritimatiellia bacterium]